AVARELVAAAVGDRGAEDRDAMRMQARGLLRIADRCDEAYDANNSSQGSAHDDCLPSPADLPGPKGPGLRYLTSISGVINQQHFFGFFRFRDGLAIEDALEAFRIELTVPLCDDDGGQTIADQIRERARAGHEAIDPDQQREARDRQRRNRRERRRQRDESAPRHARRAL